MADTTLPPEYEKLKQFAQQRLRAQGQENQDALARRFASLGGLNTGAYIKQQEVQAEKQGQATEEALGNIDIQGAREAQRQKETAQQLAEPEKQRQFLGAFQDKVFAFDKESKLRQLDLAEKSFKEEQSATAFNKGLSALQAGVPFDFGQFAQANGLNLGYRPSGGGPSAGQPGFFDQIGGALNTAGTITRGFAIPPLKFF